VEVAVVARQIQEVWETHRLQHQVKEVMVVLVEALLQVVLVVAELRKTDKLPQLLLEEMEEMVRRLLFLEHL
jgi:hypothetical protein